ncbi:RluA family pseudouridine synthase [Ovoidimarina sediminis]|uniref:RluA family pseudouridine synthase n=1 Tax=Ovoidimarina sediminis TaxID=3079856 RepID=UPI002911C6D5|nr:RluA family pseudouridine synthase [Rhodophyticola sp. MJ-SS7]MDU8945408.1 RluA family pseudouridine synthase [Rhodophyticola sp. MJ-SS7]
MPPSVLEVTICDGPPDRLDKALARSVPEAAHLSRSRLARMIAAGDVAGPGGVVRDQKARAEAGEVYRVTLAEAQATETRPEAIPLDILFEDADLVVVNKPAGMVVHPAPGTPGGTLVNALLHHFGGDLSGVGGVERPGIVHRIDKDTSGLLVAAKSDRAHHGLAAQFEAHSAERRYLALCHGVPDAGDPRLRGVRGVSIEPGGIIKIQSQLARHKSDRQRQAVVWSGGRHAVTRVEVLESFLDQAAFCACRLETGRTHQIRVHMAHAGHGLIGDPVYGGRRKLKASAMGEAAASAVAAFPRQALHAAALGFEHPVTGEWLAFEAEMPPDMSDLLGTLRAGAISA